MTVTYKGVPDRVRWLEPSEKFKLKGIITIGDSQTLTMPSYDVELELAIGVEESDEEPTEAVAKKKRGRSKKAAELVVEEIRQEPIQEEAEDPIEVPKEEEPEELEALNDTWMV